MTDVKLLVLHSNTGNHLTVKHFFMLGQNNVVPNRKISTIMGWKFLNNKFIDEKKATKKTSKCSNSRKCPNCETVVWSFGQPLKT